MVRQRANAPVPGTSVKTVINSHHHFDHAGGLRAAAGAGRLRPNAGDPPFRLVAAQPAVISGAMLSA
jgi:glyoxylase-like metal-dependent hydrolase (beta-lactamase superfamily II)